MTRVFENTSALLAAHLIGRLFSLVVTLLLMPRYFGDVELGSYFLALFLTSLIASISELGMHTPLIREMTLHLKCARHLVGNALIIRILLSIAAFGLMIVLGRAAGYPPTTMEMIKLLGLAEIINSIAQLYRCVFRAFEEMKYEAFTVVAERSVVSIVGGGLIVSGGNLAHFCVIVLVASGVNLALSVGLVRQRFSTLRFRFDLEIWRLLMRQALPFAPGDTFHLVYFRIDAIMLEKLSLHGVKANAWYGLAYTIVNAFTILPGAFLGAMFPAMARAFEANRIDFRNVYTYAFRWMCLIGTPFAVGMAILGPRVGTTLFPRYPVETVGPALSLLGWSGGLVFLTTVFVTVLRAADKRVAFSLIMGVTTLFNIVSYFLLIPRFDHIGAAMAMILSEGVLFIACFFYISRRIATLAGLRFAIKSAAISVLMGVALIFLRNLFSIWVLIPLAILFYGVGITALGELRRNKSNQEL